MEKPEEEKENKKIRLIRCLPGTGIFFFFFQNEPPPLRVVITGFSLYVFLSHDYTARINKLPLPKNVFTVVLIILILVSLSLNPNLPHIDRSTLCAAPRG